MDSKDLIDRAKEVGVILEYADPGIGLNVMNLSASFEKWSVKMNVDKSSFRFNPERVWMDALVILLATVQNSGGQCELINGLLLKDKGDERSNEKVLGSAVNQDSDSGADVQVNTQADMEREAA